MNTFLDEPPERRPFQQNSPDPLVFTRSRLRIEPDERQAEVLQSEAKRGILLCTRQWGKSTIAAAKAVHRAFTQPESLVLVASPSDRQSGELVRKAATMVRRLGLTPRGDGSSDASLVFPNGSRIIGLPGREWTVRGFSASLLLIDEAARMDDGMYQALRPSLSTTGGDLWLMSTPWHRRGFFYEVWEHGGPRWMRVRVPATECPRISKDFLEEERSAMGPVWFGREYMCEFRDEGSGVFARDLVEGALKDDIAPMDFGNIWKD